MSQPVPSARLEGSAFRLSGGRRGERGRKARGFPQVRRQSRFVTDVDATLEGRLFSLSSLMNGPFFHVFGSSGCSFMAFFVSFRATVSFVFWKLLLILKDLLGSFRLNSIFFAFLANSAPPAGRSQTHPRALSSGHLHRSTKIGYHITVLVSSAKMQEQE
jgi:hypothetical protein